MLKTGKRLNPRRYFSEDFKRKVVESYERGEMSVLQLSRSYKIHPSLVYDWIYKFSNYNAKQVQVVEMKDSQTNRIKELEDQIKQLEQTVGQKQMKIDFLEKLIELANETYSIDVKKNSYTPPSGGSKSTKRK